MSIPPACLQGAQQPLLATLPFFLEVVPVDL